MAGNEQGQIWPGSCYFRVPAAFVETQFPLLKATAVKVYLVLAKHADAAGVCWPSISRICQTARVGRATAVGAIGELETAGIVRVERNQAGNRYLLMPASVGEISGSKPELPVVLKMNQSGSKPELQENYIHELNPIELPPRASGRGGDGGFAPAAHSKKDGFAQFWHRWPSRQNRERAWRAWDRLNPPATLTQQILAAVDRQKAWDRWVRGYIPDAGTWLEGQRWLDEEPPPRMVGGVNGHANHVETDEERIRRLKGGARGA